MKHMLYGVLVSALMVCGASGQSLLTLGLYDDAFWDEASCQDAGGIALDGAEGEAQGDAAASTASALVMGRYLFYNECYYDGWKPAIDAGPLAGPNNDDADAIDPCKRPLLPGAGQAVFANWTGYTKGINGLAYDIVGATHTPTASDFVFINQGKAGTGTGTVFPSAVQVWPGMGVGGSDRVFITFVNGQVKNCWLKVIITTDVGLAAPDVSYWGNAVGDTGNDPPPNILVNASDEIGIRAHPRDTFHRPGVCERYDLDKDGIVNATDQLISRNNFTSTFTCVKYITR